jgi:hypothetical protein
VRRAILLLAAGLTGASGLARHGAPWDALYSPDRCSGSAEANGTRTTAGRGTPRAKARKSPEKPWIGVMTIRPEDLSDEHLNQISRFLGLPPRDAKELERWRGFLRWMRSRYAPAPDPRPGSDKPPRS